MHEWTLWLYFPVLQIGQTALIRAVANGQSEIVKMLLAFPGVDVNLVQKVKLSTLYDTENVFSYDNKSLWFKK